MVETFSNQDGLYSQWLEEHPLGFVLNGNNPETENYQVLHRADCPTILGPLKRHQQLTVDYLKRCCASLGDLISPTIKRCGHCQRSERLK